MLKLKYFLYFVIFLCCWCQCVIVRMLEYNFVISRFNNKFDWFCCKYKKLSNYEKYATQYKQGLSLNGKKNQSKELQYVPIR